MRAYKSSAGRIVIFGILVLCFAATSCTQNSPLHYKQLKYSKLGDIKIPEVQQVTLKNGMRLFLLEDHELPLISVSQVQE